MSKYCSNCGTQMAQNEKFCAICGTKYESNVIVRVEQPKNKLTNAVINKALHNQRHSVWEYLGELLWFGLMLVLLALGRPLIMIFSIPWAINIVIMIKDDIRRSKLRYYVLERPCIEKKFVEDDDKPDEWQLWFENMNRDLKVAISVERDFHDSTEVGEEFYIVFLLNDKIPCLCYRKSEWTK